MGIFGTYRMHLCALAAGLMSAGCAVQSSTYEVPHQVQSFAVQIVGVSTVTDELTGESPDSALPFPREPVSIDVQVSALDEKGELLTDYNEEVSFRVTPGQVLQVRVDGQVTENKMMRMVNGVGRATLSVEKVFGRTVVWVHDSPPPPSYKIPMEFGEDDEGRDPGAGEEEEGGEEHDGKDRTYAAGVSQPVFFAEPSISDVQRLIISESFGNPAWDNRSSPLVGNYLTIERPLPLGDMIVTAVGAEGFYLHDLQAQPYTYVDRNREVTTVGDFGSIFVYSFSYPDGLVVGDRLTQVAGTVQEFSGHTQLVFPSWVRVEGAPRPQDIPEPFVFDFSQPGVSSGYRICKLNTAYPETQMNVLCGYSNNNIEIESLESALVKVVDAVPSNDFKACDSNGNSNVPPFRYIVPETPTGPDFDNAKMDCDPGPDQEDCLCNRDCVMGMGEHDGKICSELTNYRNYGQWLVMIEPMTRSRINVITRDALPEFDPAVFAQEEYEGCTLDITGNLRQVQAARPRWAIIARDRNDICCRAPEGKVCPDGIPVCPARE